MTMRPIVYGTHAGRMFDDFFKDAVSWSRPSCDAASIRTDVKESEDGYEIDMDLPGFSAEDLKAELKDGYMTVSADRSGEKEEKDESGHYIRRERYSGKYRRSFYVGDAVTREDIKAKYADGVLTLCIPKVEKKAEEEAKHYIPIEC